MFARSLVFLRGQLGTYIVVHTGPPERMGTWGTVPPPFLGRMVNLISIRGTDYAHLFQPSFLEKWFCKLGFFSGWRKVVLQTQIFFLVREKWVTGKEGGFILEIHHFLEPLFYTFLRQWMQIKWLIGWFFLPILLTFRRP